RCSRPTSRISRAPRPYPPSNSDRPPDRKDLRMISRPLVLALAFALLPATAAAEDLLQTYELARAGDPQFAAAESGRLATREGAVQARASMLPQLSGTASLNRSRSEGPA